MLCSPYSIVVPLGFIIPDFSYAILSNVSPKILTWSREIDVITDISELSITLVASYLPPSPTSSTTISHLSRRNHTIATTVIISNSVIVSPSSTISSTNGFISVTILENSCSPIIFPFT